MYIATVPNRSSPPAILLRESYREGGKVKTRTLANLTSWPAQKIQALRRVLADKPAFPVTPRGEPDSGQANSGRPLASGDAPDSGQADSGRSRASGDTANSGRPAEPGGKAGPEPFEIQRSLPHGHVAAVLGTLRRLGLDRMIAARPSRPRSLVLAMIVARVIDPRSKLATARGLGDETAFSTLGEALDVAEADANDLYAAMDWLLPRQPAVEKALAARHLAEHTLVLYDVTSTYYEGRTCPLAQFGHSRDGRKNKQQIVFGLLCNAEGCPVGVEVFEGNTADPRTLTRQIEKIQKRFGLKRIVWVGDRGMLTQARIDQELRPAGFDWITALRAPQMRELAVKGTIQPSLFDERDLAEITSPAYPGERLVACRNPLLAEERARKRKELLAATEKELDRIVAATQRPRNRLRGKDRIALRVGRVIQQFKMGKHFHLEIGEDSFRYERDEANLTAEAALDGMYIIRTSLPADALDAGQTVLAYKGLSAAERAFRSLKTVDLKVRPIHHRLEDRVKAHVLLCMLAYYVEWHMRKSLAPILFDDDDKPSAQARRTSAVARAQRSKRAEQKAAAKRTQEGEPVHSFQTLLADLATLTKNHIRFQGSDAATLTVYAQPTPVQQRALRLLQVSVWP